MEKVWIEEVWKRYGRGMEEAWKRYGRNMPYLYSEYIYI
jgi:hypothetical protein